MTVAGERLPNAERSQPVQPRQPPSARTRFVMNVATNVTYMVGVALLMLWYVPYLVDRLGVAAYGIVPLANAIVLYMTLATEGLDVAVNRYLTIDLSRDDFAAANRTFNTAFFAAVALVLMLSPVAAAVVWFFPQILSVPPGAESDARVVFGAVIIAFFLTFVAGTFEVSAFARHRFDLRNFVRGATVLTRVGIVVVIFQVLGPRLWAVGGGFVLGALVTVSGAWMLWRRLTPELHLDRTKFHRPQLRALLTMSAWSIVNRMGMLLFLGIDLIIVNVALGAANTGEYGILIFFPELLRSLADTVATVINPAIVARYAVGDVDALRLLAQRTVKVLGLLLALPVGLMCGLARPFLELWLGPGFGRLDWLLVALVLHLSVNLATLPLSYVMTSYNKVRLQGTVTLALSLLNVGLALTFALAFDWGSVGIAAATAIVFSIKNQGFMALYTAHLLGGPLLRFARVLAIGAFAALGTATLSYVLARWMRIDTWIELISVGGVVSGLYALAALYVGLRQDERALLVDLCPAPIRRWLVRVPGLGGEISG